MVVKKIIDQEYLDLVHRFPLRPLRSKKDLKLAVEVIDDLTGRSSRGDAADDYLDVLSDLVEKYESEHHPIPDASSIDVLKSFIDDRQTNQRAVALGSGIPVSTISEILGGRRQMNLDHMIKLAGFFKVDAAVFVSRSSQAPAADSQPKPVRKRAAEPRRAAAKK